MWASVNNLKEEIQGCEDDMMKKVYEDHIHGHEQEISLLSEQRDKLESDLEDVTMELEEKTEEVLIMKEEVTLWQQVKD